MNMREITFYVAFDDKEFEVYEECEKYESDTYDILTEISEKYDFLDKDCLLIVPPNGSPDLEDWIKWFDNASQTCDFIRRYENLNKEEENFINYWNGTCILNRDFNYEIGFFKYEALDWIKVDE